MPSSSIFALGRREQADQHADRRALAGAVARRGRRTACRARSRDRSSIDGGEVAEAPRQPFRAHDRVMRRPPRARVRGAPTPCPPAAPPRGARPAGRAARRARPRGQARSASRPRRATCGPRARGARDERQRARGPCEWRARRRPRPGRAPARRLPAQRLGRAVRDDAAAVQVDEPLARRGLLEVARREDHEHRLAPLGEELEDLAARDDVDARGRLVEHEERGLGQERVRDGELLLHAAGEGARRAVAERREAGALEERRGAALELGVVEALQPPGEREVLEDRELALQREHLRHVAEPRLQRRHVAAQVDAEHARLLRLDVEEAGEAAEQRRLPGSVRADDADHLAAREIEIDPVERAAARRSA